MFLACSLEHFTSKCTQHFKCNTILITYSHQQIIILGSGQHKNTINITYQVDTELVWALNYTRLGQVSLPDGLQSMWQLYFLLSSWTCKCWKESLIKMPCRFKDITKLRLVRLYAEVLKIIKIIINNTTC